MADRGWLYDNPETPNSHAKEVEELLDLEEELDAEVNSHHNSPLGPSVADFDEVDLNNLDEKGDPLPGPEKGQE